MLSGLGKKEKKIGDRVYKIALCRILRTFPVPGHNSHESLGNVLVAVLGTFVQGIVGIGKFPFVPRCGLHSLCLQSHAQLYMRQPFFWLYPGRVTKK